MNATATIFALALASNCHPQQHFQAAQQRISELGKVWFSPIYLIPCRDSIGADYWNAACLLYSEVPVQDMTNLLKQMETDSGRVRPSHQISLDVDLIAWGNDLNQMEFNPKNYRLHWMLKFRCMTSGLILHLNMIAVFNIHKSKFNLDSKLS